MTRPLATRRALDTNVLLRYLLQDDSAQCKGVDTLFASAATKGELFFVSSTVLQECIWVLESHYEVPRARVLECIELLADSSLLELEHASAIPHFLAVAQKGKGDLSDLLIAACNASQNAQPTLTFDRKAVATAPKWLALVQ